MSACRRVGYKLGGMAETLILFRPTGPDELRLVFEAGGRAWPRRLPEQPIFYPVLNEPYARQIARDWNTRNGATGFVTRFEVDAQYGSSFEAHQVGGREHVELCVPAEELDEFNTHIVGKIELVAAYRGDPPGEVALPSAALPDQWSVERAAHVAGVPTVVLAPGLWSTCDGTTVPPTAIDPVAVVFAGEVVDHVLAAVLDREGHWWLGSLLGGEIVCSGWYDELEHALQGL